MTYANVAVTLALVFAMSGGAYAAGHYLITSTKQISPKVLKALKGSSGKNGATGANGANGAQGTAGANGNDGANGTNGKDGTSPEGAAFAGAAHGCTEGGVEFKGANTTFACNGKKGTTGFTKTLPKGETETGAWSFSNSSQSTSPPGGVYTAISFSVPLAAKLTGAHVHYVLSGGSWEGNGLGEHHQAAETGICTGSAEEPTAEPGNLCVYEEAAIGVKTQESVGAGEENVLVEIFSPGFAPVAFGATEGGAGTSGAGLRFIPTNTPEEREGWGSWAVTAP